MKLKSFAIFAMSGVVAASCAYILPAMADDANTAGAGQSMQSPSANSNSMPNSGNTMNSDAGAAGAGDAMAPSAPNNDMNPPASPPPSGTANGTDQGSPDTATGDDDY